MAITINDNPQQFSPSGNPLVYVVTSDKVGQDNFRFVLDIYIEGVSSPAYIRLKADADPSNYGTFDLSAILRSYTQAEMFDLQGSPFYRSSASTNGWYVSYTAKFGEEFGSSTTGTTVYEDLTVDTKRYAFNGALSFLDFVDYDEDVYKPTISTDKYLTNSPSSQKTRASTNRWLYMLSADIKTVGVDHAAVAVTTSSSSNIYKINNTFSFSVSPGAERDQFLAFPAGVNNLKNIDNAFFTQGTAANLATDLDDAVSYTIKMERGIGTAVTEIKTFVIDKRCAKDTVYTIHWLNRLGGIDTFDFIRASRNYLDVERTQHKKNVGEISGGAWSYTKNDKQLSDHSVRYNERLKLNTDWISNDDAVWLEELITSPFIVWESDVANNIRIPLKILTKTYETKKIENDTIFNVEIEFALSHDNYSQNG